MEYCQYDRQGKGGKNARLAQTKMKEKHYALDVVASKYIHLSCVWRWLSNVDVDGEDPFHQTTQKYVFLPKRPFFSSSPFNPDVALFAKLCVQTMRKAWPSRDLMGRHQFPSTTPNDDDYRSRLFLFYCTLHLCTYTQRYTCIVVDTLCLRRPQ